MIKSFDSKPQWWTNGGQTQMNESMKRKPVRKPVCFICSALLFDLLLIILIFFISVFQNEIVNQQNIQMQELISKMHYICFDALWIMFLSISSLSYVYYIMCHKLYCETYYIQM
ncbi:Hypothetical_protein [Hexamita inflata]|uniref:Hypothetical_protein n=1 Tax=Hexamita inflata TaxID=28002 RepID=A0AA86V467_9EUKA|nr:Hypothetical protein HINF_LOCUS43953 [Hexamita inflata]